MLLRLPPLLLLVLLLVRLLVWHLVPLLLPRWALSCRLTISAEWRRRRAWVAALSLQQRLPLCAPQRLLPRLQL